MIATRSNGVRRKRARVGPRQASRKRQSRRAAPASPVGGPATVVHIRRHADSPARIAAAYGLTVERIATANGLSLYDLVVDGMRLVMPVGPPESSVGGRDPRANGGEIGPVDGPERRDR